MLKRLVYRLCLGLQVWPAVMNERRSKSSPAFQDP